MPRSVVVSVYLYHNKFNDKEIASINNAVRYIKNIIIFTSYGVNVVSYC